MSLILHKDVLEFQRIYKEIFDEELSFEDASERAHKTVALFKAVYGVKKSNQ